MAPEEPEDQIDPLDKGFGIPPGRCFLFQDMTEEELIREAQTQYPHPQSVRIQLFLSNKVHAVISPGTLRGCFSMLEMTNWESQNFYGSRSAVLWDVADLSDALYVQVPYFQTNPGIREKSGKPFNLTMSVSHIQAGEGSEGTAPASPSNLMRVHREVFYTGPNELCDYIAKGNVDTELPVTAFVMEIPGEFPDEWIRKLNYFADGHNFLGLKHIARFRRPDLSTALQSAISRINTLYKNFNPSVVVTNERGPNGRPIVVGCNPTEQRISLSEGEDKLSFVDKKIIPTRTILIRPMFFRRPCDESVEHLT